MRHTYLFVLCPPFSGSTLLYRLLATSPRVSTLLGHGNWAGEGQALPEVAPLMRASDPRDNWDASRAMPWDQIRAIWERYWDLSRPVLAEKSPPNLCRAAAILDHFGRHGDVAFVGMMRSPYAVKQRAALWIEQANFQVQNQALPRYLGLTYEELCADPAGVAARILAHVPEIGSLDPELKGGDGVDGERGGALEDKTSLTRSLVEHRTRELEPHADLVQRFGYSLLREGEPAWEATEFQPELEVRRRVAASPERVARAWTDAEQLRRWWAMSGRDGERFVWVAAGPPKVEIHGRWLERTPRRLTFARDLSREHHVLDDTVVEITLEPDGEHTEVVVRELRVARSWREGCAELWRRRLDALATRGVG